MRACIVVFSLLFAFCSTVMAKPATTPHSAGFTTKEHVVIKGETLSEIAAHFGVPMSRILSPRFNPALAARNNPDRIFAGETIQIPLPAVSEMVTKVTPSREASAKAESAVAPSVVHAPAASIGTTVKSASATSSTEQKETAPGNDALYVSFLVATFLSGACLMGGVSWLYYARKSEVKAIDEITSDDEKGLSPVYLTAEKIHEILSNARVMDLVAAMAMPITTDERGNPVLLGNIGAFMKVGKRNWVKDVRVGDLAQYLQQYGYGLGDLEKGEGMAAAA